MNSLLPGPKAVSGYIFREGNLFQPRAVAVEKLTDLNYTLTDIKNDRTVEEFTHDAENFQMRNIFKFAIDKGY